MEVVIHYNFKLTAVWTKLQDGYSLGSTTFLGVAFLMLIPIDSAD